MESSDNTSVDVCLNCGSASVENYCAHCGQKAQPTRLPVKDFIKDASETLFNLDNRWLKTLRELFFNPGKLTKEYIQGKRAYYLPPLRIYISVSIVYFLLVQLFETDRVFFITIGTEAGPLDQFVSVVQYGMFFLVPVFALFLNLFYRKRNAFFVEHLIFSIHIHAIWFVLFSVDMLVSVIAMQWTNSFTSILSTISDSIVQLGTFIYVILYLKRTFSSKWWASILIGFGIMTLYTISLVATIALYYMLFTDIDF